jgi:hypothetical protein
MLQGQQMYKAACIKTVLLAGRSSLQWAHRKGGCWLPYLAVHMPHMPLLWRDPCKCSACRQLLEAYTVPAGSNARSCQR